MDKKSQGLSENDAEIWRLYISNLKSSNDPIPYKHIYEHDDMSRKLDLHGMTIHDAWLSFVEFTEKHRISGTKEIVVITGRSGRIAREFTEWCRRLAHVRSYEPIETRSGKVGSYRLRLR